MIPSVEERQKRRCSTPRCILWNEEKKSCTIDYPDGTGGQDEFIPCRYHLTELEYLAVIQKFISKNRDIGIPRWLDERLDARYEKMKPAGVRDQDLYSRGYGDALAWVRQQSEFPCEGCGLSGCSHHGTTYNCAGNCSTK